MKKRLLFVITQFYKGGAEVALLNLLCSLSPEEYEVDLLILDQAYFPNAVSLIPKVPPWVNICDAAAGEGLFAYLQKIRRKLVMRLTKRLVCRIKAIRFVRGKQYDFAFSYGEWLSPEFVAHRTNAVRKAVWIHTDIDKAPYIDEQVLFGFMDTCRLYLFVSNYSMQAALRRFPILTDGTYVIHNMCNDASIRALANEPIACIWPKELPVVVTVGNIRAEKNHLRQVEAMRQLHLRGVRFVWLNIGSTADLLLCRRVRDAVAQAGLKEYFLLLGADDNPYRYMASADVVAVLSDYESWSLTLTEAKLLAKPIIATRTSGALEQIEDGVTGLLTDFTPEAIADTLERALTDASLRRRLSESLTGFSSQRLTQTEWDALMAEGEEQM
ncbi:glycosyltransferase [Anaerotruncus colihominis]|uniref:glycosyltransferase n=1 Tax=Anaerotruncus colihominis TaxID=169435 RepID=UPI0035145222